MNWEEVLWADSEPTVIDIRYSSRYLATCPECGIRRGLPEQWQALMRTSMPYGQAREWDGVLRCRNGHSEQAMIVTEG